MYFKNKIGEIFGDKKEVINEEKDTPFGCRGDEVLIRN